MKLSRSSKRQSTRGSGEEKRFCRGCGHQLFATRWGHQEVCSKPCCQAIVLAHTERRLA
ncbi:hypothetical protein LWC35_24305 [Pseudonocardia kujensis]|uniref:hypothetical protein n=1 Tax=Pseudonocardia kujensis TaxID=1128675 RepID=UPI001E5DA73F|nr:hypothetical protein [Pseudonocardia kujensis]MCE0766002.1 hypothetical protein [Pseudonocardia kujensis]